MPEAPRLIQSENTFLVGYVIFDKKQGKAEVDVVKEATKVIEGKIQNGELKLTKAFPTSLPETTNNRNVPLPG